MGIFRNDEGYFTVTPSGRVIKGATRADVMQKSGQWRTINGSRVLIGKDGKVIAGAGGKLNGMRFAPPRARKPEFEHVSKEEMEGIRKRHGRRSAGKTSFEERIKEISKEEMERINRRASKRKERDLFKPPTKEELDKLAKEKWDPQRHWYR